MKFNIFKNKKVLVTGDTGFKGSWLSLWLLTLGAKITGYALPPVNDNDHFNLLGLSKLINHIDGDIRDYSKFNRVVEELNPEFLFHLAAQPIVRTSYQDPKYTFDTNVGGTTNVLEAIRNCSALKSAVIITSDKCYQNKEWQWGYRENDELGGRDPYSASKAAAEIIYSAYQESFFKHNQHLGVATVRAGNVIGGGDWSVDRIVPDCIRALQNGDPIILRNPNATRPWQYVLEPLSGYLNLAAKLYETPNTYTGSWNFGPKTDSVHTVGELAEEIIENWEQGSVEYQEQVNAPHEAGLLQLNCDKAYQQLSWQSRWGFAKTIKETALWYKHVLAGKSAIEISRSQIKMYEENKHD